MSPQATGVVHIFTKSHSLPPRVIRADSTQFRRQYKLTCQQLRKKLRETRNPEKQETRNKKQETQRNKKQETQRNKKQETQRNKKPRETRNKKPRETKNEEKTQ
jgi:hypothetical protein